jgi:hypothetical protein
VNVTFLASDYQDWSEDGRRVLGGSGWYRCWLPAEALHERRGHDTAVVGESGVLADGRICGLDVGGLLEPADVVVIQRPFTPDAARIIARARKAGQGVVVDVDDHYDGLDPRNQAFARTAHSRDHLRAAMRAATLVTTTTPELRGHLLRYNPTVAVVENAVNLDDPAWSESRRVNDVNRPRVVGWVGMTSTRSGDLELLQGILGPALAKHGWSFEHRGWADGAPFANDLLGLDSAFDNASAKPSLPPWRIPELYAGLGLVLVPLADVPFNRCKSWVNGLNAGAAGLPFLASWTPAYDELDGGPLCRRPREWIRELDRLLGDADYREACRTCSTRAAADHTMAEQVYRWETVLLRAALSP